MRGREKYKRNRRFIQLCCAISSVFPKGIRLRLFESFRGINGGVGIILRYALLKTLAAHTGENVTILSDVYIKNIQKLSISDNVSIHPMSYIECVGGVTIGNNVSIAEGTSIISFNHKHNDLSRPIKYQGIEYMPIVIEDDVWIGAKATILGNVNISRGSIVAAGAVVTKSNQPYSIIAGVPAKAIGSRIQ